jgi:hypothetical protein
MYAIFTTLALKLAIVRLTPQCTYIFFALVLLQLIVVVFTTLAFTTPNWLEGDPRFYGTKMEKLGLWVHCFRSLPDYNDLRHQGSILRNSISAENFLDKFLSSNFGQSPYKCNRFI